MQLRFNRTTVVAQTLVLSGACMPVVPSAFGQSSGLSAPTVTDRVIDPSESTVNEEIDGDDSPIRPQLASTLLDLDQGNDAAAIATIERIHQTIVAGYDVQFLDDIDLLVQVIQTLEASGDARTAWRLELDLSKLIQSHPTDLRTVAAFRHLAYKRLDLLRRFAAGERPLQIELGCYYNDRAFDRGDAICSERSGNSRGVRSRIHRDAVEYLNAAIQVFVKNARFASDELHELEWEVIRRSYEYGYYGTGRASLVRLHTYHAANSSPFPTRARSLVQVADWDIVFLQRSVSYANWRSTLGEALEVYSRVYAQLKQSGIADDAIQEIFSPSVPIVIPTYRPSPFATSATPTGEYIDVAFDISYRGKANRVEIVGTTANVTRADRRALEQLIRRSIFRPQSTDGNFRDTSSVTLRYYLTQE